MKKLLPFFILLFLFACSKEEQPLSTSDLTVDFRDDQGFKDFKDTGEFEGASGHGRLRGTGTDFPDPTDPPAFRIDGKIKY